MKYKQFDIVKRNIEDSVPIYEIRKDYLGQQQALWDMFYSIKACKKHIDKIAGGKIKMESYKKGVIR
jgi:hypothetical protein